MLVWSAEHLVLSKVGDVTALAPRHGARWRAVVAEPMRAAASGLAENGRPCK